MIQAYKVVDTTATHITYEYNPICSWWLYSSFGVMLVGFGLDNLWIEVAGALSILLYCATVYFPALKVAREVKRKMASGHVQLSGSRMSFTNPLRIRALRTVEDSEPTV